MPTYQRFEYLPVWRDAIRLVEECEDYSEGAMECITWSKRDQLDAHRSPFRTTSPRDSSAARPMSCSRSSTSRVAPPASAFDALFFERRPRLRHFKSQISNLNHWPRAAPGKYVVDTAAMQPGISPSHGQSSLHRAGSIWHRVICTEWAFGPPFQHHLRAPESPQDAMNCWR
jgi:hypothetical protein